MEENSDKKVYVTIPNKGEHELTTLLDKVDYLRKETWSFKIWTPTPALIDKSGGSSRQYVGQKYDAKYFDLIKDGWTHDHCEICFHTISNIEGYGDGDGYTSDSGDWICKECYNLFIQPKDVQTAIQSLKTVEK